MLSALLAVVAAIANGLASVLQRKEARERPQDENLQWRLVWSLLHRPVWFGGVASLTAGFLLQAAALSDGRISVVESVLVLDLPVALVLSAVILGGRLGGREWALAAAMAGGLAGLLVSLSPSKGSSAQVPGSMWATAVGANLALVAAGVAWGRLTAQGPRKAAVLGTATSCGFGLTAALITGATAHTSRSVTSVFTSWQLYAMVVVGAGSLFLLQSAVQAGGLLAAQPGISLGDPVVSILWGALVFHETVRGGLFLIPTVAAAAVVVAAGHTRPLAPTGRHDRAGGPPRARPHQAAGRLTPGVYARAGSGPAAGRLREPPWGEQRRPGRASVSRQGTRVSEAGQESGAGEAGQSLDPVVAQGEHDEAVGPPDRGVGVGEVEHRGGLVVGPGGEELELPSPVGVHQEACDAVGTSMFERLRRHGQPGVVGQQGAGVTERDAGVASGLIDSSQQLGGAIGIAVASTVAAARTGDLLGHGRTAADALTGGFHQALWACGLVGLAAVPLALLLVRRDDVAPPPEPAQGRAPTSASAA